MTHVIGLDIGTSAVKAVLLDDAQAVLAEAEIPLRTHHPSPLASEQEPDDWNAACETALSGLARAAPGAMAAVRGMGLAGHMHAAVLLDQAHRPIRPAMLWNDGRAHAEADALKALGDELAGVLGVRALAGLTAPKLAWLARHEPASLARTRTLLSTKDHARLHLTGELATDVSDAAGTWLLDEAARAWSPRAVAAVGIDAAWLPRLLEGSDPAGTLRPELAARFGMPPGVVVAAGGGDTPVGGVGIGTVEPGRAFLALGTSAQVFVAAAAHRPAPTRMVHSFCHAVPGRWYQMAALLNGASVLGLIARLCGREPAPLLAEIEAPFAGPGRLLMLPYLAGERTPHDDPLARGVILGLSSDTTPADLGLAALEAVAFSLADGRDALAEAGIRVERAGFIGGGARSRLWGRILASVLGIPLETYAGGARGPAHGAARLARLALGEPADQVLTQPVVAEMVPPDPALTAAYAPRLEAFRSLYRAVRPAFAMTGGTATETAR